MRFFILLAVLLLLISVWILPGSPQRSHPRHDNRPIINQEVAAKHQALFSKPQPVSTRPGIDYIPLIEKMGVPKWRGRWTH